MPKESLDIRQYKGTLGAADPKDVDLAAAVYSENLDPVHEAGLFKALPLDSTVGGYGNCSKVQPFGDGTVGALVDVSAGAVLRTVNLSNMSTAGIAQSVTRSGRDCMVSDGEAVHVGLGPSSTSVPKWVGEIFHQQFSAGTTGIGVYNAELERAEACGTWGGNARFYMPEYANASRKIWDNSQVNLRIGYSYAYFASYVYDGHQEGPIHLFASIAVRKQEAKFMGSGTSFADTHFTYSTGASLRTYGDPEAADKDGSSAQSTDTWASATYDADDTTNEVPLEGLNRIRFYLRVRITGSGMPVLPRRVTGINIYRSTLYDQKVAPWEFYTNPFAMPEPEFLTYLDINSNKWGAAVSGANVADFFNDENDTYRDYEIFDDFPAGLETFKQRTGYNATLDSLQLNYGVSVSAESHHIVGQCWHPELKDINTWLFKSKPYRYDTFDWVEDYLVLPSQPNALAYWAGKVYAFADNRTYVVSPGTFDHEDTWEGIGCPAQQSVIVTDRGMFWADNNNLYWHDGARARPIGGPILKNQYSTAAGWLDKAASDPVVVYDARYDSAIFCHISAGTSARAWMFNIEKKTWNYVVLAAAGPLYTGFQAPSGRAFISLDNGATPTFYSLFDSATLRSWKWVGTMLQTIGAKAYYYLLRLAHNGSRPTVKFYDDDNQYAVAHTVSDWTSLGGNIDEGELTITTGAWLALREMTVELEGTNAQEVSHISIIRRLLSAK